MNNLKSLIRFCEDKPMQIITNFILKSAMPIQTVQNPKGCTGKPNLIRYIDSQAFEARDRSLRAGIVDPDIAFKGW